MTTIEKCLVAGLLVGVGVAAGMWYEHQRFVKEIQGLKKKHDEPAPVAQTVDVGGGAAEVVPA